MDKQSGFSALEGLLILVIAGIVGFAGWFLWHSKNSSVKSSSTSQQKISNFNECKNSTGSKILETFPEICVTKDGKRFTQTTPKSSASDVTYGNGTPVPASSQARAKAAGYYCPSWDAKPGEVAPDFCAALDK